VVARSHGDRTGGLFHCRHRTTLWQQRGEKEEQQQEEQEEEEEEKPRRRRATFVDG
jgi:hypothetical protein